jgi:transcriptional regulator with XRE-family HTH domain
MTPTVFGMRLKEQRTKRKMSQDALAKKIGVSREYIARLEGGHHDPPLSTVEKLAKALGVKAAKLIE